MNLLERLKRERHPDFYNYYKHDLGEPFSSLEDAKEFIYKYFASGSPKHILNEWENSEDKEVSFRNGHTVNVFFIGGMLQRMIDSDIKIFSETCDH